MIHNLTTGLPTPTKPADYVEIFRVDSMSVGVYRLDADATDPQTPHTEDEVYYVIAGAGLIEVNGESSAVGTGSTVFVPALVPHRFHSITEPMQILVFFAPAEYSRRTP